jgi:DNA-binding MarR family transcriptional regulator
MSDGSADGARGRAELAGFLPYQLSVTSNAVSSLIAERYRKRFALKIPEWRVMAMLGQFDRLTARDVGELSHMHKTKVSRAVSELVERGLIERTPNRDDRREAFLSLSAPGRRI